MKMKNGLFILNNYKDTIKVFKEQVPKDRLFILCIVLYLVASFIFQSKFLYNWDAGQFALGTEKFSLSDHQPHPPGYFLFVYIGKFLNNIFDDINTSFVFVNIVAGLIAVAYLYKFLYLLSEDKKLSFWGTSLFIVNPIFWFYHSVALTYTFEALLPILLAYLTFKGIKKGETVLPTSSFLTAFIAGFRPSTLIIAFPFLVSQLFYSGRKSKDLLFAALTGLLGGIVWFPFFVMKVGGTIPLYKFILAQLDVAKATKVYDINPKSFLFQSFVYALHLPLGFLLLFPKKIWTFIRNQRLFFLIFAVFLQLTVYLFLHFGEVGYILSVVPLFYLILVPALQQLSLNKRIMGLTSLILISLEAYIFLFGVSFISHHKLKQLTYLDIKTHDSRVENFLEFINKYNNKETLVILLRGQFLAPDGKVKSYPYDDIRLLSYYLPNYTLYDLLGVKDIYFIAEKYNYTQKNQSEIEVSNDTKDIIFFADYIYPEMRPAKLKLNYLYNNPNPNNIYWGQFDQDEFEYNGMTFKKAK